MRPFQKLLVPVDFSACSAVAVAVAADMARRYDAALTLVHVYDPFVYAVPDGFVLFNPAQLELLLETLAAQLGQAKEQALAAGAPHIEMRLLQGPVGREIIDAAARGACDLIVMGTHGRTGIRHLALGSIAETVVRTAGCAVLTVKARNGAGR
jgi:nucleotide-binding universal stress UspA family protein